MARICSSGAPLLGLITNALKPEKQNEAYGYGYGKYGSGKYGYGYGGYGGYGYAAYDTSNAYSYYTHEEDAENESDRTSNRSDKAQQFQLNQTQAPDKPLSLREQWRNQRRRFIRWIDS